MERKPRSSFSEKFLDSGTGCHSRNTSIVIQSSSNYSVLFSKPSNSFHGILSDPLYKFPILTLEKPSRVLLNLSSFTSADSIDMKETFSSLHQKSPFQRTGRSNLPSDASSYISSYKNTLEMSSSYLRSGRHCDSFKRPSVQTSESSLAQTYLVNLNLDTGLSFSTVKSDEVLFNPGLEDITKIEWDAKEILSSDEGLITSVDHRNSEIVVELMREEDTDDSKFLFNSIDALRKAKLIEDEEEDEFDTINDEGSIRISAATRLFLPGQTASKDKLIDIENIPKIVQPSCEVLSPRQPDLNSPLVRKIVVFEEPEEFQIVETRDSRNEIKALQLLFSMAAVGFSATPHIEFSNFANQSKGNIVYKNATVPIIGLFSPKVLRQLKNLNVKMVSCGYEHAAVLTIDGKVLTWGYGASGCLGQESKKSYSHPTAINSIFNRNMVYLECGAYHTAAISADSEVWTWGRGDVGQLGLPSKKLLKDEVGLFTLRPNRVKWLPKVCSAACGEAHTLVLSNEGKVFAFGWDEDGQLGIENSEKEVRLRKKAVKVAAGALFSAALLENGEVWMWGNGEMGQLGMGNGVVMSKTPLRVQGPEDVIDVVCGENSVLAVERSGKIFAWGQGTVSAFTDSKLFPSGSDIVCFLPHPLCEVDIVHKVLVKKKKMM